MKVELLKNMIQTAQLLVEKVVSYLLRTTSLLILVFYSIYVTIT